MRDHPIQCPDDLEDRQAFFYPDIDPSCPVRDFDHFTDLERGEYDCIHGHKAENGKSSKYYQGYGQQYAREQQVGAIR